MSLSPAAAALALGMREEEIRQTQPYSEGDAVQTHDGNWSLVVDGAYRGRLTPEGFVDPPSRDLPPVVGTLPSGVGDPEARAHPVEPIVSVPGGSPAPAPAPADEVSTLPGGFGDPDDDQGPPEVTIPASATEPVDGDDEVPDGSADEVLAWVGDDPDRANEALKAEEFRDKPRTGLTRKLEEIAG